MFVSAKRQLAAQVCEERATALTFEKFAAVCRHLRSCHAAGLCLLRGLSVVGPKREKSPRGCHIAFFFVPRDHARMQHCSQRAARTPVRSSAL